MNDQNRLDRLEKFLEVSKLARQECNRGKLENKSSQTKNQTAATARTD